MKKLSIILGGLINLGCFAQTVNQGTLTISPNTQFSTISDFKNLPSATFINDGETFIYGHFVNDGVVSFSPGGNSLTHFEGTSIQQLMGGSTSYFLDIIFNNSSSATGSFEVSSQVSISGNADFQDGIVQTDGFGGIISFEDGSSHTSTNDGSHVDGNVYKNGNDAFQFPVGDGQLYRYSAISSPLLMSDKFSSHYFFQNPNNLYPLANKQSVIQQIDDQEYWEIRRENGNSTVLITLSYDEFTTTPASLISYPLSELHIVRWDVSQNKWVDEGGVVDPINKTITTPVELDNFGIFTIAHVIQEPTVFVSEGLTPNNDGFNDVLKVEGIDAYPNTSIVIFNRWGAKVFESENYQNDWTGISTNQLNVGGDELPEGTYYYVLILGGEESNSNYHTVLKGYFYLKRD